MAKIFADPCGGLPGWQRRPVAPVLATAAATGALILGAAAVQPWVAGLPKGAAHVQRLLLGVTPIHILAPLAGLAVLACHCPRGDRCRAMGLCPPPVHPPLWRIVKVLAFVYPAVVVLTWLSSLLWSALGRTPTTPDIVTLMLASRDPLLWAAMVATVLVLAPVAEEILFRLLVHDAMGAIGAPFPAVIAAALFALVHESPEQMPGLFLLGLVLQYARRSTGWLVPAMLLHACFNALSVGLLLAVRMLVPQ